MGRDDALLNERPRECLERLGVAIDERVEALRGKANELGVPQGIGRGDARLAAEQRQLPHAIATADLAQGLEVAELVPAQDLQPTAHDDVPAVRGIALAEQGLAPPHRHPLRLLLQVLDLARAERAEEGREHLGQLRAP